MDDRDDEIENLKARIRHLELERAEARAWVWSDWSGIYNYDLLNVAGGNYDGREETLPSWLLELDGKMPNEADWWPQDAAQTTSASQGE